MAKVIFSLEKPSVRHDSKKMSSLRKPYLLGGLALAGLGLGGYYLYHHSKKRRR